MKKTIHEVIGTLPQVGEVTWICTRPVRRTPVVEQDSIEVNTTDGIVGDHYKSSSGKRQVTLMQTEHLAVVGSVLNQAPVDPALTRRNIMVSGVNLLAFKNRRFRIGSAVLEATGPCEPCSYMEDNFGPGGYNAMRGHGGICARVIEDGTIRKGDKVELMRE